MIIAITKMEKLPDSCFDCDLIDSGTDKCVIDEKGTCERRPHDCPLREDKGITGVVREATDE